VDQADGLAAVVGESTLSGRSRSANVASPLGSVRSRGLGQWCSATPEQFVAGKAASFDLLCQHRHRGCCSFQAAVVVGTGLSGDT
jgi:hypothetical protein